MVQKKLNQTKNVKITPAVEPQKTARKVSYFEWGVLFLGVFCLMAGLGLVIASNWDMIPPFIKVLGGLALLGNGLFAVYSFHEKQKSLGMEASLFFSFLMIGVNIALIQQTYHLSITFGDGALLWSVLAVPFLFLTKKRILPVIWIILFAFGAYDYLINFIEPIFRFIVDVIGYRGLAGFFFLFYLLGHMGAGKISQIVRRVSLVLMIAILFFGDVGLTSGDLSFMGIFFTSILIGLLTQAKNENKPVRFFNIVLVYVALRVIMLFWVAYASLFQTGMALICFGAILLGICFIYYTQRERILELWNKGFNQ